VAERHENLLSYARYTANIASWQRMFGDDNILVLIHEDIRVDWQLYIDRLCAFIGAGRLNLAKVAKVDEPVAAVDRAPVGSNQAVSDLGHL
jgi:hypothetical protein